MLHNRSFAKDCLVSRNPEADFQHDGLAKDVETVSLEEKSSRSSLTKDG